MHKARLHHAEYQWDFNGVKILFLGLLEVNNMFVGFGKADSDVKCVLGRKEREGKKRKRKKITFVDGLSINPLIAPVKKHSKDNPKSNIFRPYFSKAGIIGE